MTIALLKHQAEFIQSNYRHTGLVGGFRCGKSQAGVYKTIVKKLSMPKVDVAYYLPTYPLIKDIAFPKFTEILTLQKIPFTLNKSDKDIITPYGRIIMRSMDNPDLIIGYEVGYSLVDEADVLSKSKMQEVMIKILARNSVKYIGNNNATDFVSTPEGYRFLYDFFETKKSENKLLIKAKTKNNPFISDDYIASLQEQYNEAQLLAYLDGEFVNLTSGTVYNEYNVERNGTQRTIQDTDVLHIGMDFNITKMNAVVHVIDSDVISSVDEFVNYYDTQELCTAIKERYPNHRINVYPDASGNNRNSAGPTDIEIIKRFKFNVLTDNKNPLIKDRINTTNTRFRLNLYFVNKIKCPVYSDALNQLPYKNDMPDKSSGLDHITDAGTYPIYYLFGRKKRNVYI